MDNIEFQVSAKTARLIGRENISDVDGAILELVKNGYDADADCVYIKYINPYNNIPKTLTLSEVKDNFEDCREVVEKYYYINEGKYILKDKLSNKELYNLTNIVLSLSKIIVLDNGCGMTQEILKTAWMNIGTDDKEINIYSKKKKRIKTGAKGIGRFALDKLSLKSQVFTKSNQEEAIEWIIDWRQFDDAKLLNQVKASITNLNKDFIEIIHDLVGKDIDILNNYDWSTGTLIVLSPIREFWTKKSYEKVNNNLQNINPLGSVDKFDVIVKNTLYPELDFQSINEGINRDSYDYLIDAEYDGNDTINITLDRNEIDINKKYIEEKYSDNDIERYDLDEFWDSEKFKREKYHRNDFNGKIHFKYSLKEILQSEEENLSKYSLVGSFKLKIYYLKNNKSTVEIVKDFKSKSRTKLLKLFSGIKIYRDNFKVRPYGDEGQFADWINLSERVQKSPAAASHESGNWRVSPNQVIGSISISRINNPKLEDTANREGMVLNDAYYNFINIIQGILTKFEYDRQYPLREYATWHRIKTKAHDDRVQEIYEQVMKDKEQQKSAKESQKLPEQINDNEQKKENEKEKNYNEEDLKDVIYSFGKKQENELTNNQLLMLLSSAGVMAQTFSHEISRIATNLGTRGQHIKASVDYILHYKPYMGDEDFNPYDLIDELNGTDQLLSEWVDLIMESVDSENFHKQEISLVEFLNRTKNQWETLLNRKYIKINNIKGAEKISLSLPVIDLHLLVNNFLLNSAYFLEEAEGERIIDFKVYKNEDYVYLDMKNNGPQLNEKYKQNPDEILNARVSSKNKGTGLGLWIANESVIRNSGTLKVVPINDGFMLRASWKI